MLPDVLTSCRRVATSARLVQINDRAVRECAARIDRRGLSAAALPDELQLSLGRESGADFVLLCDCLNFCFWSDRPWVVTFAGKRWTRTYAMLAGLVRAIGEDESWLRPDRWATARRDVVERLFAGEGQIPLLDERVEVLRETGDLLMSHYAGRFINVVEAAAGDALTLARILARDFQSFRDVAEYDGQPVAFLKRAQICAADLAAQWSAAGHGSLAWLEQLTVFADYRLPQLLRHWGILELADTLAERIESQVEIPSGSAEEVELRAATVCAGDQLARCLNVPPWKLDYFLWERSHDPEVTVQHHRTRTIFY